MKAFLIKVIRSETAAFAVLLTLATQAAIIAINVCTGVITARWLGPDGRGLFTAISFWPAFLAGLASLGLPNSLVYHIRNHRAERNRIVSATVLLSVGFSTLTTIGGWLFVRNVMRQYPPEDVLLGAICIGCTGIYAMTTIMRQILSSLGLYRAFSASNYLPPLLYLVSLLLVLATTPLTAGLAAMCLIAPSGLVLIMMFRVLRQAGWRFDLSGYRSWQKRLLSYAAQGAPLDTVGYMLQSIDRLVLIPLISAEAVGLYAVAFSLSRLLLILQTAIFSIVFPAMTGRARDEVKALHDHGFRLVLYSAAGAVMIVSNFGGFLLVHVYGPDFAGAIPLFQVLLIEAGITCVGNCAIQLYVSLKHAAYASICQIVGLVVAASGLVILVPSHGALGATLSLLMAAAVRFSLLMAGIPLRLKLPLPRLYPTFADVLFVRSRLM